MKKVLIFYASYGGGHFSSAKSIKEYIDTNYPDVEAKLVDCVECTNKVLNKLTIKAYTKMAQKAPWAWGKIYYKSQSGPLASISSISNKLMAIKLAKYFKIYQPDLIISTHPFGSQMCSSLKKHGKLDVKSAVVMTDYAPHDQWLVGSNYIDYFFVAHDEMKNKLIKKGIESDKIFSTGIPLSNRFLMHYNKEEILKDFGLVPDKKIILFFAGGELGLGKSKTLDLLKTFSQDFDDIQVVAISGKNPKMNKNFQEFVRNSHKEETIKVFDYTTKIPELMIISDIVVTKPGRTYNN